MQPFSFTAQGDHLAPQSNMSEALALVRAGKLDAASRLLMEQMGASRAPATPPPAPRPSSPFSAKSEIGRAARLLRGASAAGEIIDVQAKPAPATVPDAPAAASSSGGKAAGDAPGAFARVPFQHGGAQHPYFLYTPSTPAPAMGRPLVLMLHGCTQDAQDFARGTRMNAAAEAAGALVLYPSQASGANANGCWNWFRPQDQQAGAGEPALLLAMVRDAMASQAVDARRVYVAGLSAGGAMAALLAREYPEVFAAAGVHSGLVPGAAQNMMGALSAMKSGAKGLPAASAVTPASTVPLIVFHGEADSTVHPRNGEQLLHRAGAAVGGRAQHRTEAGRSADGQHYTRTVLHDGAAPGTVLAEHWLLHGAGHAWSGGDARGSHTSAQGVDASREMLRFFLEHPQAIGGQRAA